MRKRTEMTFIPIEEIEIDSTTLAPTDMEDLDTIVHSSTATQEES